MFIANGGEQIYGLDVDSDGRTLLAAQGYMSEQEKRQDE